MSLSGAEYPEKFSRDAFFELDFVWYGVDKIGNIGFFESGTLPIPHEVFESEPRFKELDAFFRNLPKISGSEVASKMDGLRTASGKVPDFSGFLSEAGRGVFYFNEMDTFIGEECLYGYFLIVIPLKRISFSSLPERIQELLEPFRFPIIFSDVEEIDVTRYFVCS